MPPDPVPTPTPTPSPSPTPTPSPAPVEFDYTKPFAADAAKTVEENAAAQKAYDEGKVKFESDKKAADEKAAQDKANDTKQTPFKADEIKLPEGMTLDETVSKDFVELVNKHGLPRSAVADLVNLQAKAMTAISEKGNQLWDEMQTSWQTEVTKDPDVGGDKQTEALTSISKLIDQYGDGELRGVFDLTGAGNNVHVVKFLAKIAKELGEKGPVSGSPGTSDKTLAERLYPNQGKQ